MEQRDAHHETSWTTMLLARVMEKASVSDRAFIRARYEDEMRMAIVSSLSLSSTNIMHGTE